jgi:flagellar hook protein FlgE
MMRSLFAGVAGIRNHQIKMDVIGNNIANVNTIAFKSSRATFAETFASTFRGATRPTGSLGGINPSQIGLGMGIGFMDSVFNQGSIQSTNVQTDLAINGDGFFILSDGEQNYFSRAGSFRFDSTGRLVNPTSGRIVQGKMADANGVIQDGGALQDLTVPFGLKIPASATSKVNFTGNLNAADSPLGTITLSSEMLGVEEAGDGSDVGALFAKGDENAKINGLTYGLSTITVDDGTTTRSYTYVNNDGSVGNGTFNSLDDLIAEINADYAGSFQASLDANGAVVMTDLSGSSHTLSFTSDNSALQSAFSSANGAVDSSASLTTKTDEFSHVATKDENLTKLRSANGTNLDLSNGDTINLGGSIGTTTVSGSLAVTAGTTLDDLANAIKSTFSLTEDTAVTITDKGTLNISGDPGTDNALTGITIRESNNTAFNSTMIFSELQKAKDVEYSTSITAFDGLGDVHVLTMTFEKGAIDNQWIWSVTTAEDEVISSGGAGQLIFNPDGSLNTFAYDNGVTALELDPGNGADLVRVQFDLGEAGSFNGVTQFAGTSNTVLNSQDGHTRGDLTDINIGKTGEINGIFSNGVTQVLGQIQLAKFVNPNGLNRVGNNEYVFSASSGLPIFVTPGESIQSDIVAGSVEMSNVDLAREFTDMILAQRGFQANARIITTGDEMLQELVNIKR